MLKILGKTLSLLSVVAAVFLLCPNPKAVQAGTEHNIRGWAYNADYGYISMNCLDDNFAGRFPFTFPFSFFIPPCSFPHGVNLDFNNNFSGQAWNSTLGFIDFASSSTPPDNYAFNIYCTSTCNASNSCTACYNEDSQTVHGWAKVASSSVWIKLDDSSISPVTGISNYQSPNPGIFSGYASSSLGIISFNCSNDNSCGWNNYGVRIGPLEIRQLTAPNWGNSPSEACGFSALRADLVWNRRSGTQTAYQVIVSSQNSTSSGVILNTGQVMSAANHHLVSSGLSYNVPYYWFLKLWDSVGSSTSWRQFNTSATKDILTHNQTQNTMRSVQPSLTFTTYKHEFPKPSFTFAASEEGAENEVSIGSSTLFTSTSNYYNDSGQYLPCTGSGVCSYLWSITGDINATNTTPTGETTEIVFTRPTSSTITLRVTNDNIYTCSTSTSLIANYGLPIWKEVKAQ